MTSPLLKTKLHIPPARPDLVARPHLIAKLNQGLTRPLILISAPPGFGKTTLLTTWLEQQSLPAAWYSLDERDNDLARFLAYLVAALETVQPDVGRQALARVHGQRKLSLESVMTLLSNDIATMPTFVLVLDDYHLVELQAIHDAMAFLLDHLPPLMHLVIATRADPPLPLARLRARDQLIELRVPDLRFTLDEAATFLNQHMGLSLTAGQIAALDARAEGWIAGLQLAALSMQGHHAEHIARFVKAFTGSNRFVLDYLTEEVLQRQTPEIQSFLLQTSILNQMNASLADAVTGRNDSSQVLAQLDKANLFVIPLDDARQWYRYHHLFADLLHSRLQQVHSDQITELHQRASHWYEQNGLVNEAIDHALATRDFERAARLIEQATPALLVRGEDYMLRSWLAAVPDDLYRTHPALDVWQSVALVADGQFELAEARLGRVDGSQLDPLTYQGLELMRAVTALFRIDLPHAIESAREALRAAEIAGGDPTDPQAAYNRFVVLWLAALLIEAQLAAGQLRAAHGTLLREFSLGESAIATLSTFGNYIHLRLAELAYETNDLDATLQHATQALELSRAEHNEEFESYALAVLAQIKQAQGDSDGALDAINQAVTLGRKRNIPTELRFIGSRRVQLLLQQNRLDAAAEAAREMPDADTSSWFMQPALTPVASAHVLIAQGEFDRAAQALERLQAHLQASGEMRTLIQVLALQSLARHGQGNTTQAAAALERALSLAEPESYVRTFVDLGEAMRLEIRDWTRSVEIRNPSLAAYADKLLAAFHVEQSPRSASNLQSPIPKLLSERELEVLRLIAEGLSNQEIAERLVVTLSTVRTHTMNIYGKLGVRSRTQALVRARQLKLL